jgi:dynein heavy chain 1, cytosolic
MIIEVKRRGASSERPPAKLAVEHQTLQNRIEDVRAFRRQHKKLADVILAVLVEKTKANSAIAGAERSAGDGGGNNNNDNNNNLSTTDSKQTRQQQGKSAISASSSAVDRLEDAYQAFAQVDVLDVSQQGNTQWDLARKAYNESIDRIETKLIARLRDRLSSARTPHEMFAVFGKFNVLFFRPRIRGAIQEYQGQLLAVISRDIRRLQQKFRRSYWNSGSAQVARLRDMPATSGSMHWARQIERRLFICVQVLRNVIYADRDRRK